MESQSRGRFVSRTSTGWRPLTGVLARGAGVAPCLTRLAAGARRDPAALVFGVTREWERGPVLRVRMAMPESPPNGRGANRNAWPRCGTGAPGAPGRGWRRGECGIRDRTPTLRFHVSVRPG